MKKADKFRKEFLKTMIQLATAGFGLTAALAWNEAIQAFIKKVVPVGTSDLFSKMIYAFIVTAIAVTITYILGKMLQNEEKKEEKK